MIPKLLLPFEKYHIPNLAALPKSKKSIIEDLNHDIVSGKYKIIKEKCLCGHSDFHIVATVDANSIVIPFAFCTNCGLISSRPRFSETFYKEIYTNGIFNKLFYSDGDTEQYALKKININTGLAILKTIERKKIISDDTKVLEIGAGAGWNLIPFIKKNAKVLGLEINQDLIQIAKKFNLPVEYGTEQDITGLYDVIILSHILEHLPNPIDSLFIIGNHLKDNGIIYIAVPNAANFDLSTLQLPHIYYFSLFSLKYVCSQAELIPIVVFETEKEVVGLFKKGFYKNPLLLQMNYKYMHKVIKRRKFLDTIHFEKRLKSFDYVPGKIFYQR